MNVIKLLLLENYLFIYFEYDLDQKEASPKSKLKALVNYYGDEGEEEEGEEEENFEDNVFFFQLFISFLLSIV